MKSMTLSRSDAPRNSESHGGDAGIVVDARAVSKRFGALQVLDDVSFQVPARGRLGLLGPSGSGKSTLLSMVAGLQNFTDGSIRVNQEVGAEGRLAQSALMPQKDMLFPWRTALENACLALHNQGIGRAEARRRVLPLFERVGLADFVDSPVDELSGGMRQRVAFLRTLVADKDVLLLDEPFGALDSIVRAQMQEWLLSVLTDTPQTLILVTHDVEEALYLCDQVVVLSARPGRVALTLAVSHPRHQTRRDTISTPEFVSEKDRILEALEW